MELCAVLLEEEDHVADRRGAVGESEDVCDLPPMEMLPADDDRESVVVFDEVLNEDGEKVVDHVGDCDTGIETVDLYVREGESPKLCDMVVSTVGRFVRLITRDHVQDPDASIVSEIDLLESSFVFDGDGVKLSNCEALWTEIEKDTEAVAPIDSLALCSPDTVVE